MGIKTWIRDYLAPPAVTRAIQQFNLVRLGKKYNRSGQNYNAEKYWSERHGKAGIHSLLGAGRVGLTEEENQAVYRSAAIIFKFLVQDMKLTPAHTICEYGFGSGFYTRLMAELGYTRYTGFDITDVMIDPIAGSIPGFKGKLYKKDISKEPVTGTPPREQDLKDLIYMIDVTQHITNDDALAFCLRENVNNLLKEGGFFITTDVLEQTRPSFYEAYRTLDFYKTHLKSCTLHHEPIWFRDKYIFSFKKTAS